MADIVLLNCTTKLFYHVLNVTARKFLFCFRPEAFFVTLTFDFTRITRELRVDDYNIAWPSYSNLITRIDFKFYHPSEIANNEQTIRQKLSSWSLTERELDELVLYAIQETEKYTWSYEPSGRSIVNLDLKVVSVHEHVVRENMDRIMQLSFEETVLNMVPATEESIKSLKRKRTVAGSINKSSKHTKRRVDGICDENCVICLEEFTESCEAVCMPCKHEFHGGCIEEWLRASHYCPICRYEMPTKST